MFGDRVIMELSKVNSPNGGKEGIRNRVKAIVRPSTNSGKRKTCFGEYKKQIVRRVARRTESVEGTLYRYCRGGGERRRWYQTWNGRRV